MMSIDAIREYGEIPERFEGITELDPRVLGHFAFFVASDQIQNHLEPDDNAAFLNKPSEWEQAVGEIVWQAQQWKETGRPISRYEFAKQIEHQQERFNSMVDLLAAVKETDAVTGLDAALDWMTTYGYSVRTHYRPSPLFPEGREAQSPVSDFMRDTHTLALRPDTDILGPDGEALPPTLDNYLKAEQPMQRDKEMLTAAMESIKPVDHKEYEELRSQYGSKAAALLCFKDRVDTLNQALGNGSGAMKVEVPPLLPVSVDVYDLWRQGDDNFAGIVETLRQRALSPDLSFGTYLDTDLVIIRSSAVASEDGEEHTGAGVYLSVAVDPHDPAAFRSAIEQVYASCDSPSALSYRELIGVKDEKMGLVIQPYLERPVGRWEKDVFYGHANSIGANPNLIEVITDAGELLYDKPQIANSLLIGDDDISFQGRLHTSPDHDSQLRRAVQWVEPVPQAAILAEKLFGKPMQIEFVNGYIVQVRPLLGVETGRHVEFPEDVEPSFNGKGVGVGDMELSRLSIGQDNSDERGFVVFTQEYEFTISDHHAGYKAFPKEGAVIILNPSSSGHIQAYCREKGLLCFYPKNDDQSSDQLWAFKDTLKQDQVYRFISDGYRGSIY